MHKPRLGYIGLGAMGLPFARHLAAAGCTVTVKNRSDRPYAEARAAGLQIAETVEAVVAASDIVFTCLPSLDIIDAVYAALHKPGLICVDNSTVPPDMARRLHEDLKARDMAYVECPIFGMAEDAEAGTVYLILSGDNDPVETVLPIAALAARDAVKVGGPGTASLIKVLQNGLGHVQMVAIAETLVTAERAGVDLETFVSVVSAAGGMAATPLFAKKAPHMLDLPSESGAKLKIAAKDISEAAKLAKSNGLPETLVEQSARTYQDALSQGFADMDFASIMLSVRQTRS